MTPNAIPQADRNTVRWLTRTLRRSSTLMSHQTNTQLSIPAASAVPSIPEINLLHRDATTLAEQARTLGESATRKAIMLGLKLAALKEATPHGQWEALFASGLKRVGKSNGNHDSHLLEFDRRTALKYIAVASNMMSQRLTSEQSAALMQLAARPYEQDLVEAEITFLEEVTPEKSLRQLYLNLGIIQPTLKEQRAMQAGEEAAGQPKPGRKSMKDMTLAERHQATRNLARLHWFNSTAAGMVNPDSMLMRLMDEARNPAEAQLNYLCKQDLQEIEQTLKDLLKITKQLIAEAL